MVKYLVIAFTTIISFIGALFWFPLTPANPLPWIAWTVFSIFMGAVGGVVIGMVSDRK